MWGECGLMCANHPLMIGRVRLVALLGAASLVAGLVACSAREEEDAEVADNAFSQEQVENDPILKALRERASDVSEYEISVAGIDVPVPSAFDGTSVNGFRTHGLDWFRNPAVRYPDNKRWEQGTDTGKKCQWAAIFRFHSIFSNPPAEARELVSLEGGTWSGGFWSWIDDYASTESVGHPRQGYGYSGWLFKWIGASGAGDTCRLPTKAMMAGMMKACLVRARANNGNPEGCEMPRYSAADEAAYPYAATADAGSDAVPPEAGAD